MPASSPSLMTSLGLMRPFLSSFDGELTVMTGNASSIRLHPSPVVGNGDIALATRGLILADERPRTPFQEPKPASGESASTIHEVWYPLESIMICPNCKYGSFKVWAE